jgi:thioredoxin reductase
MDETIYDCIVVGAGPAGLSAALFLARYRYNVLTFHFYSPRNIYSHGVHGFLGHHGILPTELLARGREEVTMHGGKIIEACVRKIEKLTDDHFRVAVGDEEQTYKIFSARRIVLATGLRDLTPDCEGFRDFYGSSVFHCPDCDGYEVTGKRVAVLGHSTQIVGFAFNLLTWTNKLMLITNGDDREIPQAHKEKLAHLEIPMINKSVSRLEGDKNTRQVERVIFADGSSLECDALFFHFGIEPASNLHNILSCKMDEESGLVWTDEAQQTSIQGVYAAGDISPRSQLAVVAAAEGAMAAIQIHKSLIREEWKLV